MKFRNSTDFPDHFLRRLVSWTAREIGISTKTVRAVTFNGNTVDFQIYNHEKPLAEIQGFLRHIKTVTVNTPQSPPERILLWGGKAYRIIAHRLVPEPGKEPTLELVAAPID